MKIKIVSQNVRHCNDGEGHMVADRIPRICSLIDKYDPDVVGFQEVREKWLTAFSEHFSDRYEIHHKYRAEINPEATTMMWKKDKFDCVEKGWFWLSPTPHIESHSWGCGSGYNDWRIVMWATLRDKESGLSFTYFNTHYSFGDERHRLSNQLIRDHIREKHIDAAVVTADFNFSNTSVGYRDMVTAMGDLNADTVNDPRTTFSGYKVGRVASPIDFIFYTKETVKPITYHLMDEMFDGYFASDHFGIYGEIELQEKLRIGSLDLNSAAETETADLKKRISSCSGYLLFNCDADVIGLQNATEDYRERLSIKTKRYDIGGDMAAPISYNKAKYAPEEVKTLTFSEGKACTGMVLKNLCTGQRICVVNAALPNDSEERMNAIAQVKALGTSFGDLPVFYLTGLGGGVTSDAYEALTEGLTDVRRAVASQNTAATKVGFADQWVEPGVEDFIFTNGKGSKAVEYGVQDSIYGNTRLSDHNMVTASFILE